MILEKIEGRFPKEILQKNEEGGDPSVVIRKDHLNEVLQFLRDDPGLKFELLMDLCGVDRSKLGETLASGGQAPRFEVVYHLYSLAHHHRLRLRVQIPEGDLTVPSAVDLWRSADWLERECWEMFGIHFSGHPNLKHLLLFDGFEGFPLRKDYPIERRQKIPMPEESLS